MCLVLRNIQGVGKAICKKMYTGWYETEIWIACIKYQTSKWLWLQPEGNTSSQLFFIYDINLLPPNIYYHNMIRQSLMYFSYFSVMLPFVSLSAAEIFSLQGVMDRMRNISFWNALHAVWPEWIGQIKSIRVYFVGCVSMIKSVPTIIFYMICGTVWFQLIHFSCDDHVNKCTISYHNQLIIRMNHWPLFKFK